MKIGESAENYLETIYILANEKGSVRSIDIVHRLNYSKPSVSIAMKNLRESGYIQMADNGHITLTDEGLRIADDLYERHTVLSKALMRLGVDEDAAVRDACRIEHVISRESFEAIKRKLDEEKA